MAADLTRPEANKPGGKVAGDGGESLRIDAYRTSSPLASVFSRMFAT